MSSRMAEPIALIFDIDDTLYDQLQPFHRAYNILFADKPVPDLYKLFLTREKYSNEGLLKVEAGEMTKEEMYIHRMKRAMADHDYRITEEEALEFQRVYKEGQSFIYMTEVMKKLLDTLQMRAEKDQNMIIGIISNGPSKHQWNKVRVLGVTDYIPEDHIFISGDTGYIKPDPDAFYEASRRLHIDHRNIWYIGDNLINDIKGAHDAGWHTIWMNRRPFEPEIKADRIVHSEEELSDLLCQMTEP